MPQDIICILPDSNIIKKNYCDSENIFYNYKNYINKEENKKYKISIIYTFSNIDNIIEGLNKDMSFMISEIKSEDGFKTLIGEIKIKNENKKINKEYNIISLFILKNLIMKK